MACVMAHDLEYLAQPLLIGDVVGHNVRIPHGRSAGILPAPRVAAGTAPLLCGDELAEPELAAVTEGNGAKE